MISINEVRQMVELSYPVKAKLKEIENDIILAANQGNRSYSFSLEEDVADDVCHELLNSGFLYKRENGKFKINW